MGTAAIIPELSYNDDERGAVEDTLFSVASYSSRSSSSFTNIDLEMLGEESRNKY